MKKWLKIILVIVSAVGFFIMLDLVSIFTINRPIFAIRIENKYLFNEVYKGLLYNTYICPEYSSPQIKAKNVEFKCAEDENIEIDKFRDYEFFVDISAKNTEHKKIFAFSYNNLNFYYGNTNFQLYLKEGIYNYGIGIALNNNKVNLNNILNKSKTVEMYKDGGSKMYIYDNFNILVCNTLDGNKDIIIGDNNIDINQLCQ